MAKQKSETATAQPIEWFVDRINKTVTLTTADGETATALIRNMDDAKKMFAAQDAQAHTYTDAAKTEE